MNWLLALGAPMGYLLFSPRLQFGDLVGAAIMYVAVAALFYAADFGVVWLRKKIHGSN